MGETSPAKVPYAHPGYRMLRNVVMAAIYLVLVPVVAAAGLSLGAQYFPDATLALFGPAVRLLASESLEPESVKADEALSRAAAAEGRLSKIEEDMARLVSRVQVIEAQPVRPPDAPSASDPEQQTTGMNAAIGPLRAEGIGRDRMLAGFTALALARSELAAGNRAVAIRELALAMDYLSEAEGGAALDPELGKALSDAMDALQHGSSAAGDYLSLSWHLLADLLLEVK
ncbi:MAG: hypothetical protein ACM3WU_01760 [Bacillota bacterium]